MTTTSIRGLILAAALAVAPWAAQAQSSSWLHVQVIEEGEKSSKVHVNVPISLAQAVLEIMPDKIMDKVTSKLEEKDISVADLRRLWTELEASGDSEFVTVEEDDQTVRVAREGDWLRVRVDEAGDGEDKQPKTVRVDIPIRVVDALLSGEGDTFNLAAAVEQLKGQSGDIVQVRDGNERVRVWIGEKGD